MRSEKLPSSCEGCVLSDNVACGKFTAVEGAGTLGVMIVGEASGETEAREGLPFRPFAPAGSELMQWLRRLGFEREQFWITNVLRCRPPKNWLDGAPWERDAIEKCRENLREAIRFHKPKVLLALGAIPLRELTGLSGKKLGVSMLRGFVLPGFEGVPVVGTYHPSFLARGQSKYRALVMQDVALAVRTARSGGRAVNGLEWLEGVKYENSYEALVELAEKVKKDPELLVAFDIETGGSMEESEDELLEFSRDAEVEVDGESEGEEELSRDALDLSLASIRTVQFSLAPGTGLTVPWADGYTGLIKEVLEGPNPKAAHNGWLFDVPILERHGVGVAGIVDDTMWMWHAMQPDLPAGLQVVASLYGMPAPWKHLSGSNSDIYGAADVDAVQRIMQKLPKELGKQGLWDAYVRFVRGFRPMVARMEKRGIPVNAEKLGEFREWIKEEVEKMGKEIQELVPASLRGRSPKEGYVTIPADVKEMVLEKVPELSAPIVRTYKNGKTREVKNPVTGKEIYQLLMGGGLGLEEEVRGLGYEIGMVGSNRRLWKPVEFNPSSSKQMLEYVRLKGYPVPIKFKDGKETTGDKEMERLERLTGDRVIGLSRAIRAASKMGNAYVGVEQPDGRIKGGWQPGGDGRLRATITFGPANWQLAARNPNVMTTPKRRPDLARRFRECIVAPSGHKLVEFDYRAFHARTLGLEARDAAYMKLADMDIHSFVAGHLVKFPGIDHALEMEDGELLELLGRIKKEHKTVRNFKAKPTILGVGFGMGYRRLYFENKDSLSGENEAKALLELLRRLFPKVFAYQDRIVEEADRTGRLVSKWGAIRWFWDVVKWKKDRDGRWMSVSGPDAEKAKAFQPANDAHGMMREKMLGLEERGWDEKFELVLPVHDALVFCPPEELVEECVSEVGKWLMEPVMELADPVVAPGGFWCAVEAMVGKDWANMEEVRIG